MLRVFCPPAYVPVIEVTVYTVEFSVRAVSPSSDGGDGGR
jgi:hypothetical protein